LHGASELRKNALANCVGDPCSMMSDLVIYRVSDSAESVKRPGLVKLHALGIGNHIRCHDCSEAVLWFWLVLHRRVECRAKGSRVHYPTRAADGRGTLFPQIARSGLENWPP